MRTIKLTNAVITPLPPAGYHIDLYVRYGTSGPFLPLASYLAVNHDTTLVTPYPFTIDETINPSVQVKVINADCPSSTPYLESFTTV